MAFESMTEEHIAKFLSCPKRVTNPNAKGKTKNGHEQRNLRVEATDGSGANFSLFIRQNLRKGMEDDFSCGLGWNAPNGEFLILTRYNGPGHRHVNALEDEHLDRVCHIHRATERYIQANRKAEGFAVISDSYSTVDGALHCLITDCNISGISTTPENPCQTSLFSS